MLEQLFDHRSLLKVISRRDVQNWNLWSHPSQTDAAVKRLAGEIVGSDFEVQDVRRGNHNGKQTFSPSAARDHIGLKLVDRYMRRVYKVTQSDRSRIVREIRSLLNDGGNLAVIRLDVKSFYESIPFGSLLNKLRDDMILSGECLSLLNSLHEQLHAEDFNGLPRGIAVSTTMAELYMEQFDNAIRMQTNTFYLARYVDDIIVLTDVASAERVMSLATSELEKLKLKVNSNKSKTGISHLRSASFDYLGYHFRTVNESRKQPKLDVSMAAGKVNRLKSRIIKSFVAFERDGNFELLLSRCRYLAGNSIVKKGKNGHILSGLRWNYQYISSLEKLKVFDGFMGNIVSGNSQYGRTLTSTQRARLSRISFYRAAVDKIVVGYSRSKIERIKKAWAYE